MPTHSRRTFLIAAGLAACAKPEAFRFTALGQSLIKHEICGLDYAGSAEIVRILKRAQLVFSNLEVSIAGPGAGEETNSGIYSATAAPDVLDCLRSMSVNLLSLSNNHSFDLGAGGILATIAEVRKRGFGYAGTGSNLTEAAAPGYVEASGKRIGLVAFASKVREASIASESPGVNHWRVSGDGVPDAADRVRILSAIEAAAGASDLVCVYQHDHYWHEDWQVTHEWKRELAKACIDAGAAIFVSHGVPLLHGIELHRGRPIFYGLGNFIFHTRTAPGHYESKVWESVIAECYFQGREVHRIELTPIALNEMPYDPERFYTRGLPTLAEGAQAAAILERLAALSHVPIRIEDGKGVITPS